MRSIKQIQWSRKLGRRFHLLGSIASARLPRTRRYRKSRNSSGLIRYAKENHPRTRKQLDALSKGRCKDTAGPSKIELRFFRTLSRKMEGLESNRKVLACGHHYYPDISNPATKRIVEVDGFHWHRSKTRRRRRDRYLRKAGWKILHLRASRSYLRKKKTIRRALKFLGGN